MNPKTSPAIRPDLDLAMFDFAGEYAQDPERALYRLQFLLLDEDTWLARVAFLQAMAATRNSASPSVREGTDTFRDEIGLLCEEGLFAAHAAGRLTPEQVRRLHRLTCNPDALLEVHRRLVEEDADGSAPADPPTTIKEDTEHTAGGTGFTSLVREGRQADLEERLRPWLLFLFRRAGLTEDLDEAMARKFLSFIQARYGEVRQRRFRDLLPGWLCDFAKEEGLAGRLRADRLQPTAADLEADAVERVLRRADEAGKKEPAWATAFREAALRAPVRNTRDLLAFQPEEVGAVAALPNYRRDLFREARREQQDGVELFECAEGV